jgi:glycosyltransferase involved in cell wall biosynthesis
MADRSGELSLWHAVGISSPSFACSRVRESTGLKLAYRRTIRVIPNGLICAFHEERRPDPAAWYAGSPAVVGMVAETSAEREGSLRVPRFGLLARFTCRFVVVEMGRPGRTQTLIDQSGFSFCVDLGQRNDLAQYASFDLLVSSSKKGSMAILWAMASGLPQVATAVGDLLSVVRNGETGISFPPAIPSTCFGNRGPALRSGNGVVLGSVARQLVESQYLRAERRRMIISDAYKDAVTAI